MYLSSPHLLRSESPERKMRRRTVCANIVRVALLILTTLSFLPQLNCLKDQQNSTGLSLTSTLLNLIVATEQLAFGMHLIPLMATVRSGPGSVASKDLVGEGWRRMMDVGDWLDVGQFFAVWFCWSVLFFRLLDLLPSSPGTKAVAIIVYGLSQILLLGPSIFEATIPLHSPSSSDGADWLGGMIGGVHSYFVTPPVTFLALAAWIPQAWTTYSGTEIGSWSTTGLEAQAVVFAAVGVSWMFRLRMDAELWDMDPWRVVYTWHNLVGWAAVYNLVFAFGQAIIWGIVR